MRSSRIEQAKLISRSVTEEGNCVKANGLGGAILWTINQAYFSNAAAGSRDPLMKAAYTAIAP